MNILKGEGFQYHDYIDIFDGGPTLVAPLSGIKTVAQSRVLRIKEISDQELSSEPYLLANTTLDFRAVMATVLVDEANNQCTLNQTVAKQLKLRCGDCVRAAPLHL